MERQKRLGLLEFAAYARTVAVSLWLQGRPLGRDPKSPNLQTPSPIVGIVYTAAGMALLRRSWPQPSFGRRLGFFLLSVLLLIVGLSNLSRSFDRS
jgi:hypothetical protein